MNNAELQRTCPSCGEVCTADPYDIGDGPEFSCRNCEWCWGAIGQDLTPDLRFSMGYWPYIPHRWDGEQWTCTLCGQTSPDPCTCPCHQRPSPLPGPEEDQDRGSEHKNRVQP